MIKVCRISIRYALWTRKANDFQNLIFIIEFLHGDKALFGILHSIRIVIMREKSGIVETFVKFL